MVYHIVMLKEPADLSPEQRTRLVRAFEHAVREIPTVRSVHLSRRVFIGTSYEGQMPDIDHAIIIEFDNIAGLRTYLEHQAHDELSNRFAETIVSPLIYDFESVGLQSLRDGPKKKPDVVV